MICNQLLIMINFYVYLIKIFMDLFFISKNYLNLNFCLNLNL